MALHGAIFHAHMRTKKSYCVALALLSVFLEKNPWSLSTGYLSISLS